MVVSRGTHIRMGADARFPSGGCDEIGDGKSFRPPDRVKRAWRLWDPSESGQPLSTFSPLPPPHCRL